MKPSNTFEAAVAVKPGASTRPGDPRTGFRHHLRRDTSAEHDAVEAAFAPLTTDFARALPAFLAAQRLAFVRLDAAAPKGAALVSRWVLDDILTRLTRDLGPFEAPPQATADLSPLAIDYLVLGSRLGTEVLRRRFLAEAPENPLPAYFGAAPVVAEWQQLCARLDNIPPKSDEAARIAFDVRRGFGIFSTAAHAMSDTARSKEGQS